MKSLSLILILVIFSSCCGINQTTGNISQYESSEDASLETFEETMIVIEEESTMTSEEVIIEAEVEEEVSPEVEVVSTLIILEVFDHSEWNALLKKYVSNEGNVNYKGFKNDHLALKDYIAALGDNQPEQGWTKEDKLAYWINAYNAMTVDLIVRNYPIKSIKDIDKPWEQRLWQLGAKWYNLDEIEHQILRKMNEPRIHFGIVCASYSCPKLLNEAFTPTALEDQLSKATRDFLSDTKRNIISKNEIKLSKIFQWFAKDFKQNGSLIDFLNPYTEVTIASNAKKKFMDYNWALNE